MIFFVYDYLYNNNNRKDIKRESDEKIVQLAKQRISQFKKNAQYSGFEFNFGSSLRAFGTASMTHERLASLLEMQPPRNSSTAKPERATRKGQPKKKKSANSSVLQVSASSPKS